MPDGLVQYGVCRQDLRGEATHCLQRRAANQRHKNSPRQQPKALIRQLCEQQQHKDLVQSTTLQLANQQQQQARDKEQLEAAARVLQQEQQALQQQAQSQSSQAMAASLKAQFEAELQLVHQKQHQQLAAWSVEQQQATAAELARRDAEHEAKSREGRTGVSAARVCAPV